MEAVYHHTFNYISNDFLEENSKTSSEHTLVCLPDCRIVDKISDSKFPIFKIMDQYNRSYVIKVFPWVNGEKSQNFNNEIRFQVLQHKNLLVGYSYVEDEDIPINGKVVRSSYVIMDYAPNGTLLNLIRNNKQKFDEVLTRTFFRQLVEGLEYLHQSNVAHLDIKTENLLLDENYNLLIADYDTSYVSGDQFIHTRGTKYKRAPELINGKCNNPFAADVFSSAMVLFTMMTGGKLAQQENEFVNGENLYNYMIKDNKKFWKIHADNLNVKEDFFSKDFRYLFNLMTAEDPNMRARIEDIKNSKWYNGPIYTEEEVKYFFSN